MSIFADLVRRAQEYAQRYGLAMGEQLGAGVHGIVFEAQRLPQPGMLFALTPDSAIKVHRSEPEYRRERDIYLRLKQLGLLPDHRPSWNCSSRKQAHETTLCLPGFAGIRRLTQAPASLCTTRRSMIP
jgi:hypothetical protein